ncbi:glycosyltransferase involved in cell wall biosynthesis [Novosphingobium sp. PhB165]|uniref:glycosyltransferase family 4 protein n=1 Tax=Novosphingobium sp. PhB165 TaxID=2485105 RepID=UPI00104FC280|nr:glycosyltransferase family 4 protein [Novosphingobium sp. PhB165]TCM21365.1 glycosyltransferase involved in cell wall biosynthesis [Novosphingobium sp. PhB165]
MTSLARLPDETMARVIPDSAPRVKIWSILNSLTSGGAEMLVSNLHANFALQGASSTVVALCHAPTLGNSARTEARLAREIAERGGFVSLGLDHRRGMFAGARALRRLLRAQRPDVIHAHTARALPMIALAGFGGPVVLTHHNSRLSFSPQMFRLFDRIVSHYVAISHEVADIYRRHSRRPFTLIANAPAATFAAAAPRAEMASPLRVLSVGAISGQKNYPLLVETARTLREQLRRRMPDAPPPRFRIAGGGGELEEMRALVRSLGLDTMIDFLGERDDVPRLMTESDVFLNTSRYEGMSVAILEAFASAMPVIATDVAGNRDLVEPYGNGLLAPERPHQLAAALLRLLETPGLHNRLSQGALATSRDYTIEAATSRHLSLYAALLPQNRAVGAPKVLA